MSGTHHTWYLFSSPLPHSSLRLYSPILLCSPVLLPFPLPPLCPSSLAPLPFLLHLLFFILFPLVPVSCPFLPTSHSPPYIFSPTFVSFTLSCWNSPSCLVGSPFVEFDGQTIHSSLLKPITLDYCPLQYIPTQKSLFLQTLRPHT